MIVRTSNDATAVNCGCCDMPACEEPRKVCQSITVDACGFSLPDFDTVPAEDRCKLYQTKTSRHILALVAPGITDDRTWVTVVKTEYETVDGERVCNEGFFSTSWSQISTSEDLAGVSSVTFDSSSSRTSECSGTETSTPSEGEGYSVPWNVCDNGDLTPSNEWSYAGGVFTTLVVTPGYTGGDTLTVEYTDQITIASLTTELEARIGLLDGADWPGSDCNSKVEETVGHADPPDPEADPLPETEIVCRQVSSVTKARYKIGIPDGYARSVFECQWDEVFFPTEWEAWKALKDAFDVATAAHDAWTACRAGATPDACADEPEVPADPGAAPTPAPSLIASRSWSYDGTEELSEWFEVELPETSGETRIVNMLVKCFHSSRLGVKPTAHGEVYVIPV